ncbi:heme ABC exporter ATP-binding protein CcmA [Achromobacter deleyi]|uniref:heme ABC exporter ATP-binding protein CcmA n=1 Tax=Achromobacter deleyi TaxID=1353891 RepID=UPI001492FEC2|nr:heme ABC exporter ATP-binding protein CcmA [Achromobacter deleyi]QVQ28967.1 heme ABC exporter ATP-binding protein CcmA [Achromobacter deleyi]UIP19085.1 heme ABC exporter ATP-binding protein CcmA [Achromobacter deleyi]
MRPADAPPPLLSACELTCRRGGPDGLGPIDLDLHAGQLLHVQGANGSGKTSLLRMLAGLLRPLRGAVHSRGSDIRRDPSSYFARTAYLGHGNGLCGELSALENLRCALHVAGTPQGDEAIAAGLRTWRLGACLHMPAARLSQGQSRRLALAAVVLGAKPLWLLDEPDAGLDAASLDQLRQALDAHLTMGGAAVVASHRMPGTPAARTQTLNMDDYADAGYAVSVSAA